MNCKICQIEISEETKARKKLGKLKLAYAKDSDKFSPLKITRSITLLILTPILES